MRRYSDCLRAIVSETGLFPLDISFAKARPGEAANRWAELGAEIVALRRGSADKRPGASYVVEWEERRDRLAGTQILPSRIYFPDERSFLSFLGKADEAAGFRSDIACIAHAFPALRPWIVAKPLRVIEYAGLWPRILTTLRWFADNPASGLYLREVPAVEDTKFIERNKAIVRELLDILAGQGASSFETFEARCGLKAPAPLIRVRILDRRIAEARLSGIDDIAVPADRFDILGFDDIERILVIENKASFGNADVFLTAPALSRTMAIFGSGYAAAALRSAGWLSSRRLLYWGDIDTHGLRILAAFRTTFPAAESVMMDEAAFDSFPEYRSDAPFDSGPEPTGLLADELALYRRLAPLSSQNRLEQERVPFPFVKKELARLIP